MRRTGHSIATVALIVATLVHAETPVSVLPTVDLENIYPYLVWTSTEGHDENHPDGFRYKLLSVRSADSRTVEFALIRELTDGTKIVALHARGPLAPFGETATALVSDFSKRFHVEFTRIDLSDVRDLDEFRQRATALGWDVSSP